VDPEFHAFVRYLKHNLPHPRGKKLSVRTRRMKKLYGSCNAPAREVRLTVDSSQEHDFAVESLMHEWAHMLDCKSLRDERREEHRQSWGKHYAKVYQHYWRFKKDYGHRLAA